MRRSGMAFTRSRLDAMCRLRRAKRLSPRHTAGYDTGEACHAAAATVCLFFRLRADASVYCQRAMPVVRARERAYAVCFAA